MDLIALFFINCYNIFPHYNFFSYMDLTDNSRIYFFFTDGGLRISIKYDKVILH